MKVTGNTILITGGSTGIGFALADAFLTPDNEVIICSRTEENLRKAKNQLPELNTIKCDVSKEVERQKMHERVTSNYPDTNVLINNAGIRRMVDLRKGPTD